MMTSYPDTAFRTTSWISSPAFSPFPYIGENFATFFINYSTSSKGPPTSPEEDISLTTSAQSSVESPTPKGSYLDSQTAFLEPSHKSQVSRLSPVKIMILYPLASQLSSVLQKGLFSHWSCSVKSQCFSSLKFLPGILDYNCQRVSCTLGVDYFTQEKIAACRAGTRGQIILGSISCSQKHWQFINIAHLFPNICDNWWRELL